MSGSKFVFLQYSLVVMVLRLVGGRLPDRFGVARVCTVATSSIALGLVVAAAWARPAGLHTAVLFLGIGMAIQYPALMAMVVNRATDRERSAVVGSFTAFFDLAGGTGGLVLGLVVGAAGYRAGFLVGACFALAALALLRLRVARPAGRPHRTGPPRGHPR
jgi:MFS family permease